MRRENTLDWVALVLLIVGGLNWGLIGFFNTDLVAAIFGGSTSIASRIVYSLVGLSAVYEILRLSMRQPVGEKSEPS